MGLAESICQELKNEWKILQIRTENQPAIPDVEFLMSPNIRQVVAAIDYSHGRLLIDSLAHYHH